jgi:hypothetical protein
MARIETYSGDRVKLRPLGISPQRAPGPDAFGAEFGETLTRVGVALANEADRQRAEAKRKADELFQMETEKGFNQMNMVGWYSQDRGPEGKGSKGILNRTGMEPHDTLDDNMKDWDAQAEMLVGEAKNADQRVWAEAMRTRQRARYYKTAFSHASNEYEKYQTGQAQALLKSSQEIAGLAAGTDGGVEIIDEQLRRQYEIVEQYADRLGLYSQEAKDLYRAQLRSETHVLAINRLLSEGKDIAAQGYFDRVMQKTSLYPDGQMFESHAAPLRDKVKAASTDGEAWRIAQVVSAEMLPKVGEDQKTIQTDAVFLRAQSMASSPKVYERTRQFLQQNIADIDAARANRKQQTVNTLYGAYRQRVPLAQLSQTPAWRDADEGLRTKVAEDYAQRERTEAAERRAAMGLDITRFNYEQARRAQQGFALYYKLSNPATLLAMKSRDDLDQYAPQLSNDQLDDLAKKWDAIHAGSQGAASITVDWEMFTDEAANAGYEYALQPKGSWTETQQARMGGLLRAVERAVAAQQATETKATGKTRRLDVDEQRAITRRILGEKALVPGWFGLSMTDTPAAMLTQDELGQARIPLAQIPLEAADHIRRFIRQQPKVAAVMATREVPDKEIDTLYGPTIERAYAVHYRTHDEQQWQDVVLKGLE